VLPYSIAVRNIPKSSTGAQYTKVIDRRVRELAVRSEVFPLQIEAGKLKEFDGIILSGGPKSVWDSDQLEYDAEIFSLRLPVLGICYGMHVINKHFGGIVSPGVKNEYGETKKPAGPDEPWRFDRKTGRWF